MNKLKRMKCRMLTPESEIDLMTPLQIFARAEQFADIAAIASREAVYLRRTARIRQRTATLGKQT